MRARAVAALGAVGRRALSSAAAQANSQLRFARHGHWANVLEKHEDAVTAPKSGQVLVRMEAAPVNPADFDVIAGVYGKLPAKLPAVAGNEGVGVVEELGKGVKGLKKGQRVIPASPGSGTWCNFQVLDADAVLPVSQDLEVEYASALSVNPCTAFRLLNDFAKLEKGDVVVQNGANSVVGQCVIQMCAKKGVQTVNIVRGRAHLSDVQEYLKSLGGTVVVPQEHIDAVGIRAVTEGLPKAKLALNCVGGSGSLDVGRLLGDGGVHVTYGGMSRQPVTIPTGPMIFNDVQARGFWLTKWVANASREERVKMLDAVTKMILDGDIKILMERVPFADWQQGLEMAQSHANSRKIVLRM
jgi:trans-2-enoyl-CoA reductase